MTAWDSSTDSSHTFGGERQLLREQTDMIEGEMSILQGEAVPHSQELTRCWMEWVSCCRKAPGSALPGGPFPPPAAPARGCSPPDQALDSVESLLYACTFKEKIEPQNSSVTYCWGCLPCYRTAGQSRVCLSMLAHLQHIPTARVADVAKLSGSESPRDSRLLGKTHVISKISSLWAWLGEHIVHQPSS